MANIQVILDKMSRCHNDVVETLLRGEPAVIFTMNPALYYLCRRCQIVDKYAEHSDLITCDSSVLAWIANRMGMCITRQTGADLVRELIIESSRPIIVIGPKKELIKKIVSADCQLISVESPYTENLEELATRACDQVTLALSEHGLHDPSYPVVLVALGPKKQEFVANELIERLKVRRVVCCGASIDFITGVETRAPKWLRNMGLEWAWRFSLNPKRKFRATFHWAVVGVMEFARDLFSYVDGGETR